MQTGEDAAAQLIHDQRVHRRRCPLKCQPVVVVVRGDADTVKEIGRSPHLIVVERELVQKTPERQLRGLGQSVPDGHAEGDAPRETRAALERELELPR